MATVGELAALVGGQVVGDAQINITQAAPLSDAGPGSITLIDRAGTDRMDAWDACTASAVVVPRGMMIPNHTCIQVDQVHRAFIQIAYFFRPLHQRSQREISPQASIHPTAKIGKNVAIDPFTQIGSDVEIGDDCTIFGGVHILSGAKIGAGTTIFPNVTIYEYVRVGCRCILHAGVVLGAYGFGYMMQNGRHMLAGQAGSVVLGDDVDLGANTTIDRGTYGPTTIGEGTKIDDQVMIGHNCHIGKHNLLCSQVGIAGSTETGDYVVMGGQVGVRDHVKIGDRTMIGAQSGVMNSLENDAKVLGCPAIPEREQLILFAAMHKLPEIRKLSKKMEKMVVTLENRIAELEKK